MVTATRRRTGPLELLRRSGGVLLGTGSLLASGAALAGDWVISPSVLVTETYSSNMGLTSAATQSGWISDLAPGLRVEGTGARLKAFLDYRREYFYYEGNSQWDRRRNLLNSAATLTAIDRLLFVDASANITQRSHSVFGPVSIERSNANSNQVESTTWRVSPYARGRLFENAEYLLRTSFVRADSDDPSFLKTDIVQTTGSLKSLATAGRIGWFSDFNSTSVRNDLLGSRDDERFRAGIAFPLSPQAHLLLSSGRESTDFAATERQSLTTPGAGLEWSSSPNTRLAMVKEKRFFGYGHAYSLAHRTALTAWRYSDTKDVGIVSTLLAEFSPASIAELMSDLLEASVPDPFQRAHEVRARMNQVGSVASMPDGGGVQTSRFYVDHRKTASGALVGQRDVIAVTAVQHDQRLLSFLPGVADSFSESGSTDIRSRGGGLAWMHRLTPHASLNISTAYLKAEALDSAPGRKSSQAAQGATLVVQLAPKASGSLGLRRSRVDTGIGLIRENAVFGSLTQGF